MIADVEQMEMSTLTDVVSPALRQYGTLRAKKEAEVGFTRVRQFQGAASSVEAGVPNPVGESGRGRGRGGRGEGRGGRGRGSLTVI